MTALRKLWDLTLSALGILGIIAVGIAETIEARRKP